MHHYGCRCAVEEDHTCYNKQTLFLQTLKINREYAKYVKTLKWTLVYYDEDYHDTGFPFLPSYSRKKPLGIWELFKTLTEVTTVEIAEWDSCGQFRKFMPKNIFLFPKAITVKLQGVLTDTFTEYVLGTSKIRQVQHLHLVDFESETVGYTSTEATIMFLDGLVGKCTALKSLIIINSDLNLDDPASDRDTEWKHYARLLESVKSTLEILRFKSHAFGGSGRLHDDIVYRNSIEKILNHGNWPRLRKVTILPAKKQPQKKTQGPNPT